MKHSYRLIIGLHFSEPDYTRGQSIIQWLLSATWGRIKPWNSEELHRMGGHEERVYWGRVTVVGVSIQINIKHCISNWSSKKLKVIKNRLPR